MAVLSLPLTFSNSFWSQDYRKGLEVLYAQLEQVRATRLRGQLMHEEWRVTVRTYRVSQRTLRLPSSFG